MQVAPSGGQIWNYCKWRHVVAKFGTNSSGAIWWSNLELMLTRRHWIYGDLFGFTVQVIWNYCNWRHLVAKFGTNASGAIWWSNLELMLPCGHWIYGDLFWIYCTGDFLLDFSFLLLDFWVIFLMHCFVGHTAWAPKGPRLLVIVINILTLYCESRGE